MNVRPVRDSDCWTLYNWANDAGTLANSFHPKITSQEHQHWFRSRMADRDHCYMWVLEVDGRPVALARYEKSGTLLEINLTVAPAHRGKGYGEQVLRMTASLAYELSGTNRCRALVFDGNVASLKTFERAGYERIGKESIVLERCAT